MMGIVEVNGLVKRYGNFTAVDGISFAVQEGTLFAFLGPNGAGKTTTIIVMCTTLGRDGGRYASTVTGSVARTTRFAGALAWCFNTPCWTTSGEPSRSC